MDNFYVLGSNLSFPTSSPGDMTGNGYQLCGRYSGRPPAGELSRVTCQPHPITARFVYIQVDRSASGGILELCEVWVYASKFIMDVGQTFQSKIQMISIVGQSKHMARFVMEIDIRCKWLTIGYFKLMMVIKTTYVYYHTGIGMIWIHKYHMIQLMQRINMHFSLR